MTIFLCEIFVSLCMCKMSCFKLTVLNGIEAFMNIQFPGDVNHFISDCLSLNVYMI